MQDIIGIIENEQHLQEKQRDKIVLSLRKSTEGYLVKKRKYYYQRVCKDGAVTEKYLGSEDHPKVQRLKKQKYLQEAMNIIDKNLGAMDKFLKEYENYSPESISKKIGLTYAVPPDELYDVLEMVNPKCWDEKFLKEAFHEENLKQITSKGHMVRSKSEIIIANQLFLNNIPYRYEPVFYIDGDENLRPDFMILSPKDNEIYLWEHFGMMKNPVYRKNALEKIDKYMQQGFYPWKNLIMTFDKEDETIDSRIISKLIELYFL